MKKLILTTALALFVAQNAYAIQEPVSISTDFRIREIPYDPNEVFKFYGHFGYSSEIEFEEGEDVKTISIGDSTAWQIVPSGNRIFIKPTEQNPQTNMTVVTNKRVYRFELHGKQTEDIQDEEMVFAMRFVYPGSTSVQLLDKERVPVPEISENPSKYSMQYSISGPERISPIRIFDDGEFTYFQFRDINADIPAFFRVDSDGREAVVNYRTVGDYVVVERVAPMFTLRHGSDIVCVFNEKLPLEFSPNLIKEKEDEEKSWYNFWS